MRKYKSKGCFPAKVKLIVFVLMSFSIFLSVATKEGERDSKEVTKSGYYFFSEADRAAIVKSAQTGWGKLIIEHLKEVVAERRMHDLTVPLLEGGHMHDYFCPIHNLMFDFKWEKPLSHYCTECGKYWEGNKRYDWAWINKVHGANLKYLEACTYLYLSSGERVFAENIRDMLLDYADKYPTYFEHNSKRATTAVLSGKMFGQSLDEAVWASDAVRAYGVAKEIMTPQEMEKIETGYLQPCADLLLKRKSGGNWQVWHNSGLIALGVALQNDSIIDLTLNDPAFGYYFLMDKHVYEDGWWDEGSPIYHFYPLRAMILSADALRCRNIDLFNQKLHHMLSSPALGVYADLSFPAHNDGWYGESLISEARLYEVAYSRFKDPLFNNILCRCYTKTERIFPEALLNPEEIQCSSTDDRSKSLYFKDIGVGILRSENKTVVLKYGPYGGGHGHPDKLSLTIHDGKRELLSDMGTSAYGVPDYGQWYRKTLAHSTVTIDAKDQEPSKGKMVSFRVSSEGGSIDAQADQAYKNVSMNRKISLAKNLLTDEFICKSRDVHQYDYVLILTQPVSFSIKGEAAALLHDAPAYERIINLRKFNLKNTFSCKTGSAEIRFILPSACKFEVFAGEAPGIPPTNPGLTTKDHTEKRAVQTCYPLIIRTRDHDLNLKAIWNISE